MDVSEKYSLSMPLYMRLYLCLVLFDLQNSYTTAKLTQLPTKSI